MTGSVGYGFIPWRPRRWPRRQRSLLRRRSTHASPRWSPGFDNGLLACSQFPGGSAATPTYPGIFGPKTVPLSSFWGLKMGDSRRDLKAYAGPTPTERPNRVY